MIERERGDGDGYTAYIYTEGSDANLKNRFITDKKISMIENWNCKNIPTFRMRYSSVVNDEGCKI